MYARIVGMTATEAAAAVAQRRRLLKQPPISPMPTRIPKLVLGSKDEAPIAYHKDWTEGTDEEETTQLRFDRV